MVRFFVFSELTPLVDLLCAEQVKYQMHQEQRCHLVGISERRLRERGITEWIEDSGYLCKGFPNIESYNRPWIISSLVQVIKACANVINMD